MYEKNVSLTPAFGNKNYFNLKIVLDHIILKLGYGNLTREEVLAEIKSLEEKGITFTNYGPIFENLFVTKFFESKNGKISLTNLGREYYSIINEYNFKSFEILMKSLSNHLEGIPEIIAILRDNKILDYNELSKKWKKEIKRESWQSDKTWKNQLDARLQWLQVLNVIKINGTIIELIKEL